MTLYKIFKENEEKLQDDFYEDYCGMIDVMEKMKQSQLAIIDGVIQMIDEKVASEISLERHLDTFESSYSQALVHLKDKLLAERKLIEEK